MKMLPIYIVLEEKAVILKTRDHVLAILNPQAVALYIPSTGELFLTNGNKYIVSENSQVALMVTLEKLKW